MASVTTDQRLGVNASKAIKVPCRACSYGANITLSGEQTIDGVAIVSGDRVLVAGQTDGSENGIYDANTGAWTRSPDWDGANDVGPGTRVYVYSGTSYTGTWIVGNTSAITIGTTIVTLSAYSIDNLGRVFATVALAKAATDLVNGQLIFILGYYAANDGGGGAYQYDAGSAATANNGTVFVLDTLPGRLVHTETTVITVATFGAMPGATDYTTNILACRTWSIANKSKMIFNGGTYLMSQPLVLSPGYFPEGQGADATILKLANGANCNLVECIYPSPGVDYIYLKGMYLDGNAANNTAGYCIEMEWVAIPSFIEDVTYTVGYEGGMRLFKCSAVEFHRVWGTAGGSANGGRVLDIDSYRSLTFVGGGFEYPAQGATETIRIRNTASYSSPLASFHGVHFEHYVGGSYANCNVFDIGGGTNDAELLAGLSIHGGQVLGIGTASGNYFIKANDDFINIELSGCALSNMTGWCTNFNAVANIPPATARHIGHWVYGNRTRVRNAVYSHHQGSVGATTNSFMRLIATGVTGTVTSGGATSVAVTIDTQPDTAYHVFVMPTAGHIGNNIIATAPDADKTTTDFDIRFINITTGAAAALGVNSAFRYFVFSTI